jgi:tRNA(Arg) A34 adenosine deaminase TadA
MKNSFRTYVVAAVIILALLFGFQITTYKSASLFHEKMTLDDALIQELRSGATTALQSNDAPIASLLLYGNNIIGRGYNTVLRDTNPGGHAEINAISNALRKYSRKDFSLLNRDSLLLISTYEPCLMCRGAILEYNIKHVQFLKGKSLTHWLKEDYRLYRYQWKRIQVEPETLQDSLLHLHPGYNGD